MLWTSSQLNNLKNNPAVWLPLKNQADIDITKTPQPFEILSSTSSYEQDGVASSQSIQLKNDCYAIWRMALVYKLTDEPIYAQKAQWFINEWCHTLETVATQSGKTDIAFNIPFMILGADLVKGYNNFDPNNYFYNWLSYKIAPHSQATTADNNVAAWSVLLETCIGVYQYNVDDLKNDDTTDSQNRINNARLRWKAVIDNQVDVNGKLPQEIDRSDTSDYHGGETRGIKGIAYTHFWMMAMANAMRIHNVRGSNLHTSTQGLKFKEAYEVACGYVINRTSFDFFDEITALGKPLDSINNTGYVRGLTSYYPNFLPATAILAEKQSTFDPFYTLLVMSLRWT